MQLQAAAVVSCGLQRAATDAPARGGPEWARELRPRLQRGRRPHARCAARCSCKWLQSGGGGMRPPANRPGSSGP
eukprot:3450685-Alexandrium_andersonii.AAC.1